EITAEETATGVLVTRREPACERIIDLFAPTADLARLLAAAAWTSPAAEVTALVVGDPLCGNLTSAGYLVRSQETHLVALAADGRAIDSSSLAFLAGVSDADLLRQPPA
ncbi:MAG: hypothetical protein KAY24_15840, partial [Candidatus Eisenbacteria sp.]|nr:hypothetical protein [Candidatus Eisenbacteria bacterium]